MRAAFRWWANRMQLRLLEKLCTLRCACLILTFLVILVWPERQTALALTDPAAPAPAGASMTWHLTADQVGYDQDTNMFTATGNVIIESGDKKLTADVIRFNRDTMEAEARGNIRLKVGGDYLTGDRIRINLNDATGEIYNGTIFVASRHFYIRGDRIRKTGKQTYIMDSGSLTTCDGDHPAWKITGKDLDVTLESYGTVKNATLWAKQLPVLYVPYFLFPVKQRRQSGLLPPQLGYSNRNGFEYIQPCFWAINRSSDATFYLHYLQQRGLKYGLEYRYALSSARGVFMADYLNDDKIDDGLGNASKDWGYTEDNVLRTNRDRYWIRGKADQELPWEAQLKLDLDIVSDQDFLREFDSGYSGYDATRDYFVSNYGRDIDDENDPVRRNSLTMNRIWPTAALNAEVIWYDDVIKRRLDQPDDTLQRLPRISFDTLKQPFGQTPLFYEVDSNYTNFFRQEGISGQRIDLHPRWYLPLSFKRFIAFEPSAGFRQTAWFVDGKDAGEPGMNDPGFQHRETYDLGADLSTELDGIFNVGRWSIEKIRHTIVPEIKYAFIPETDQSEYPFFDETDRIENQNRITFSVTQFFTAKTEDTSHKQAATAAEPAYLYDQFCRILLEQPYEFNPDNQQGEGNLLPLHFELDVTPMHLLTLHADAQWSHNTGNLATSDFYLRMASPGGDSFLVEHRYENDVSQSIYLNISKAVTHRIRLYGKYERNLKDGIEIEKGIGLLYTSQCWNLDLSMEDKENDRRFGLMVNLLGLVGIGNTL